MDEKRRSSIGLPGMRLDGPALPCVSRSSVIIKPLAAGCHEYVSRYILCFVFGLSKPSKLLGRILLLHVDCSKISRD